MYFKSLNTAKGSPLNAKITIITLSNDLSLYSKKYYTKYFKKCSKKYFKKKVLAKQIKAPVPVFQPPVPLFPPVSPPNQLSQRYLIGSDPVVLWPHAVRLIT